MCRLPAPVILSIILDSRRTLTPQLMAVLLNFLPSPPVVAASLPMGTTRSHIPRPLGPDW